MARRSCLLKHWFDPPVGKINTSCDRCNNKSCHRLATDATMHCILAQVAAIDSATCHI